ncbi:hypothetical protein BU24DRAFT_488541 [Aaosphaeria arxii CBS 175.79]|uniref:Uncharacterized protein n=1 Tax=Aaosphaeria arxii CBS 175.79 TaxID=1450172 RepID=A0A6A5Y9P2_9PLEO|nr:uncharacterized protein BU24DRAFT_488541 [Aaosphaeria arxii CBS 175.79]KAF2022302.1 hypothetical protein BU24DRAFT_488541 [Aaosphaeria arxii CBS 175.79]
MPPPRELPHKGKKRARDGTQKPSKTAGSLQPQCAQPTDSSVSQSKKPQSKQSQSESSKPLPTSTNQPSNASQRRQKRPRLPNNTEITKRPLLRPAIPSPFASAASPKIVYLKPTSPFVPATKRVRALLSEIEKRHRQSLAAQKTKGLGARDALAANGRLDHKAVERAIAEGSESRGGGGKRGIGEEEVFVKASGKAIPRALAVGNWFQRERDCVVRVEIGSVSAIDDIEVIPTVKDATVGEAMDVDGEVSAKGGGSTAQVADDDDEVPETRIRTLSTVTVAISLRS